MAGTGKPLRLKDLLELDCDSCSAAGFRCYPRRRLGESSAPLSFPRSPSSSTLQRSSIKLSTRISRSFSRRLRGSFWWRRGNDDEVAVATARGCGSGPDTSPSESSDSSRRTRIESGSEFSSASSVPESVHAAAPTAAGAEHEEAVKKKRGAREEGSSSGSETDGTEQLSPVAVMDFPCFDDDVAACSPSSDDSQLSRLQAGGRKADKIRRFRSLDELSPVGLERRFAETESPDAHDQNDVDVPARRQPRRPSSRGHRGAGVDEERDEKGLLVLLADTVRAHRVDAVSERLLLDFFVEMKEERRSGRAGHPAPAPVRWLAAERLGDAEILAAAGEWLLDGAGWGLEDVLLRGGAAVVAETERGRRWMRFADEEEREVGIVVAGVLTDQLVHEVVRDLLV